MDPAVLKAKSYFGVLQGILLHGAATRPSTAAGGRYDAISTAYFSAVHQTLTGEKDAQSVVAQLDKDLKRNLAR